MTLLVDGFTMALTLPRVKVKMERLVVQCDNNDIFTGEVKPGGVAMAMSSYMYPK